MLFLRILTDIFIVALPIAISIPDNIYGNYKIFADNISGLHTLCFVLLVLSIIAKYLLDWKSFSFKTRCKKLENAVITYRSFISSNIDRELKQMAADLGCNSESNRISLFIYSSTQDKFYSIGRYSLSSKYNKIGRFIIDDQKEYVYAVLNEDNHYEKTPQIKNGYLGRFKRQSARKMISQDMFGVYLLDSQQQNKIGVIIFQHIKNKQYNTKEKRSKIREAVYDFNVKLNSMDIDYNAITSTNEPPKGF